MQGAGTAHRVGARPLQFGDRFLVLAHPEQTYAELESPLQLARVVLHTLTILFQLELELLQACRVPPLLQRLVVACGL